MHEATQLQGTAGPGTVTGAGMAASVGLSSPGRYLLAPAVLAVIAAWISYVRRCRGSAMDAEFDATMARPPDAGAADPSERDLAIGLVWQPLLEPVLLPWLR